jgi:glycosyltransferase involved in cell wall biosynthesis
VADQDRASGGQAASDSQRFSLFHGDGAEAGFKAWHAPYANAFAAPRVADVGCGPGYFLDLIRDRGITGFGIDIDPQMVEAARGRGHEAVVGDHRTLASMPNMFSGVHLSHIIEHLWGEEAVELLEAAKTALAPGGMVIVRTPNWGNATVRHGGFWLDHTHKRPYPRELLEKLLKDLDFDIAQAGHEPGGWEDTFVLACKRRAPEPAAKAMPPVSISLAAPVRPRAPAAGTAGAFRAQMFWRGDFLPEHSFARVNRELSRAMAATGAVDIVPLGEPSPLVEERLGVAVHDPAAPISDLPTFTMKHQWPPRFIAPAEGFSIHIQPFEFGAVPRTLAEGVIRNVDDLWCPSNYVKQLYVDAGLPPQRAFVLPWGIDPAIFNPDVTPYDVGSPSTFVFFFVGGTIWRKGIDTLLDAYLAEFKAGDDVALVVKSFGSTTFYANQNSTDRITELAKRTDVPVVRISESTVNDATMASLYRRADAFMAPYRGEGFGMPVLEAMACGTPVFVTAGGATDDFVTDETGYRMPADRVELGMTAAGEELATPGWVLEVSQETLRRSMRYAFEHRDEIRAVGARAATAVRESYTWRHSGQKAVARLEEIAARTPIVRDPATNNLNAYEATIHSQNGEDGILMELFSRLRSEKPYFVEFGAEAGAQCNCASLALMFGWSGLFIEGSETSYAYLEKNYAPYPRVQTVCAMVDRENIVRIFEEQHVPHGLDLLSIDVDGNDWYLWEALAAYEPRVVVIEFNPAYPPPERWVMAYNPTHEWTHDDYYGASLASLTALGNRLGYALIGIDNAAVNAFFVRRDLLAAAGFPERTPEEVYHFPMFRQPHRDGPSLPL